MKTQHALEITGMMEVRQALGDDQWIIGHTSNDAIIFYAQDEEQAKKALALAKAAPELLEALESLIVKCTIMPNSKCAESENPYGDALKVIKKAKGE